MPKKKIFLCTGKPVDGSRAADGDDTTHAATFSRFVLPFSYNIQQITEIDQAPELHYQINPLDNLSFLKRGKYFSRETTHTLYERTLWLDMSDEWHNTPWGKEEEEKLETR